MLRVYYLLCIFSFSSASDFLSEYENGLRTIRKLGEFSVESHFLKDRIPKAIKNSKNPFEPCANNIESISSTEDYELEDHVDVHIPLLVKLGIENETHFVITQQVLCNNQRKGLENSADEKKNKTKLNLPSTQWLTETIENNGLKRNKEHFLLHYNGKPFYLAGNTSKQVMVIRTDPTVDGYLVLYDDKLFNGIVDILDRNRSGISPVFRSKMLKDYFHFAGLGLRDYRTFFTLMKNLINSEEDPSVFEWLSFLLMYQAFGIQYRLLTHPIYLRANEFFESIINSRFNETSFESQIEDGAKESEDVWPWPCLHLDSRCRTHLKNGFIFWKANPTSSLKSVSEKFKVLSLYSTECLIVAAGGKEAFDFMLEKAEKGEVSFVGLGCATEPDLVKLILSKLVDPNDKNFQSVEIKRMVWAYYVGFNKGVGALNFIRENFEAFERISGGNGILHNFVLILHFVSTKEQLKEIQEFTERYINNPWVTFALTNMYELEEKNIADVEIEQRRIEMLQWLAELQNVKYGRKNIKIH